MDHKKKLDEQKKSLQKQLGDTEKLTDMELVLRDSQKEKWKGQLQETERKRTELLREHKKMQKRSQKLQSLRDKQRNHLVNAPDGEEEMQKLSAEMEERKALYETRFRALSEKSGSCRREADILEEIQALQAGDERRNSCASQSNGCCFDPTVVEQCPNGRLSFARRSRSAMWRCFKRSTQHLSPRSKSPRRT